MLSACLHHGLEQLAERWGSDNTQVQQRLSGLFISVLQEGQEQGVLNNQVGTPILLDFFYGLLLRVCQMHLLRGRAGRMADQHGVLFDMLWRTITVSPAEPPVPVPAAAKAPTATR